MDSRELGTNPEQAVAAPPVEAVSASPEAFSPEDKRQAKRDRRERQRDNRRKGFAGLKDLVGQPETETEPPAGQSQREEWLDYMRKSGVHSDAEMADFANLPDDELKAQYEVTQELILPTGVTPESLSMQKVEQVKIVDAQIDPFDDRELELMGRAITAREAKEREAGTVDAEAIVSDRQDTTAPNPPRVIPRGPSELQADMLAALQDTRKVETGGWTDYYALADKVEDKHGVTIAPAHGTDLEGNIEAVRKLQSVLDGLMPSESVRGRHFSFNARPNMRTDENTVRLGLRMSQHEMHDALMQKFMGIETVPVAEAAASPENPEPVSSGPEPEVVNEPENRTGLYDGEFWDQQRRDRKAEADLPQLRAKYVEAKRALDEFRGLQKLRSNIKLGGDSQEKIDKAYAEAKENYEKTRAEYVGGNTQRYLAERQELVVAHLSEYGKMDQGMMKQLQRASTWLGEQSAYKWMESRGHDFSGSKVKKFIAKSLNAKLAVNLILVGVGASGVWGASALAMGARSALATGGMKSTIEMGRRAINNKELKPEDINKMDGLGEVEERMAELESRAFFDGNNLVDVQATQEYKYLKERQEDLLKQLETDPDLAKKLDSSLSEGYQDLSSLTSKERTKRKVGTAAAMVMGTALGSGKVRELMNGDPAAAAEAKNLNYDYLKKNPDIEKLRSQVQAVRSGKMPSVSEVEYPRPKAAGPATEIQGAKVEAAAGKAASTVEVGSRGVEGTVQDIIKGNKKVFDWATRQFPDSKNLGELSHRVVSRMAKESGYGIDSGERNLSRIAEGSLTVGQDGKLSFGEIEFSPSHSPADVAHKVAEVEDNVRLAGESAKESVEIGPEHIEEEKLDFEKLKPTEVSLDTVHANVSSLEAASADAKYEHLLEQLEGKRKATDVLKELLHSDYKKFMKDVVQLDARKLNRIQALKVSEFMESYAHHEMSQAQLKEYKGLADAINTYLDQHLEKRGTIRDQSIRRLLIRIASERSGK